MQLYDMPGHLIRRLHQKSTQVFQAHVRAAGHDLTPVQFAAMDAVAANPGIDQAGVAARIAYDRATIGGVIDRLETKGLVTRTVSDTDRRARQVTLTDAGQEVLAKLRPVIEALQDDILPGLSPDERILFARLARKAAGTAP